MKDKFLKLLRIFLPLLIGGLVAIIIKDKIDYMSLVRPPFSPPKWLFPVAWTVIYLLMGISYYRLNEKSNVSGREKILYYVQLLVNSLWSIIFFYFKYRLLACIWIVLLDILITVMIVLFLKKDKISAYLNIPYLLWCLFATYLTIRIYLLN